MQKSFKDSFDVSGAHREQLFIHTQGHTHFHFACAHKHMQAQISLLNEGNP